MFDNDWEKFRADALELQKSREETLIKTWLNRIGYKEKNPIGYYISLSDNIIEIFSTTPGILIGKSGVNVDELKKMLSDEFGKAWHVKFVEIRGGFVGI